MDVPGPCTDVAQKVIFHLEAFVAKFMRILEGYRLLVITTPHRALTMDRYLMGMDFDD